VPTGYAVELAALIDTVRAGGVEALAQVDLGVRAHRHQALRDLGGMATQIIAAALARAGVPTADEQAVLRQYLRGLEPLEHVVPIVERPPAEGLL
jgi:glucosyl-3-phosphoglycerate synthase